MPRSDPHRGERDRPRSGGSLAGRAARGGVRARTRRPLPPHRARSRLGDDERRLDQAPHPGHQHRRGRAARPHRGAHGVGALAGDDVAADAADGGDQWLPPQRSDGDGGTAGPPGLQGLRRGLPAGRPLPAARRRRLRPDRLGGARQPEARPGRLAALHLAAAHLDAHGARPAPAPRRRRDPRLARAADLERPERRPPVARGQPRRGEGARLLRAVLDVLLAVVLGDLPAALRLAHRLRDPARMAPREGDRRGTTSHAGAARPARGARAPGVRRHRGRRARRRAGGAAEARLPRRGVLGRARPLDLRRTRLPPRDRQTSSSTSRSSASSSPSGSGAASATRGSG